MGAVLCGAVRTQIFGQSAVRCGAKNIFGNRVLCSAVHEKNFQFGCGASTAPKVALICRPLVLSWAGTSSYGPNYSL